MNRYVKMGAFFALHFCLLLVICWLALGWRRDGFNGHAAIERMVEIAIFGLAPGGVILLSALLVGAVVMVANSLKDTKRIIALLASVGLFALLVVMVALSGLLLPSASQWLLVFTVVTAIVGTLASLLISKERSSDRENT